MLVVLVSMSGREVSLVTLVLSPADSLLFVSVAGPGSVEVDVTGVEVVDVKLDTDVDAVVDRVVDKVVDTVVDRVVDKVADEDDVEVDEVDIEDVDVTVAVVSVVDIDVDVDRDEVDVIVVNVDDVDVIVKVESVVVRDVDVDAEVVDVVVEAVHLSMITSLSSDTTYTLLVSTVMPRGLARFVEDTNEPCICMLVGSDMSTATTESVSSELT